MSIDQRETDFRDLQVQPDNADETADPQDADRFHKNIALFWNKDDIDITDSFASALDKIEINNALSGKNPKSLQEATDIVLQYRSEFKNLTESAIPSKESLHEEKPIDLMQYAEIIRKMIRRIDTSWFIACMKFLNLNNGKRDIHPRDAFKPFIPEVDVFLTQPQETRIQILSQHPGLEEAQKRFCPEKIAVLKDILRIIQETVHDITQNNPVLVKQSIRDFHESRIPINDEALDDILGLQINAAERKINHRELKKEYPHDDFLEGCCIRWTDYSVFRALLHGLQLSKSDVFYDLGSGYGRVAIYTALTTPAQCCGIELVPERVAEATAAKDRLDIDNLKFIHGHVLDQDMSDGNIFFMFNPFPRPMLERVRDKLHEIAKNKEITIISLAQKNFFDYEPWLRRVNATSRNSIWETTIYESA